MNVEETNVEVMLGMTMQAVAHEPDDTQVVFTAVDGRVFKLYHEQDSCERVWLEDINGDLQDLVGVPLLQAEKLSGQPGFEKDSHLEVYHEVYNEVYDDNDSSTWTFYRFATIKGTVTLRWCGTSNGYYSEEVDFKEVV